MTATPSGQTGGKPAFTDPENAGSGPNRYVLASILTVILALNVYIYSQSAGGPYIIDDYTNLVANRDLILKVPDLESIERAALSSGSSPFYRPISMLSFALNYTISGDKSVYSVKLTNIYLHIITGVGVFLLTLNLLPRFRKTSFLPRDDTFTYIVVFLTVFVWLFHPLFISTVLYPVQRMAILSTLFIVYGCLGYVKLRDSSMITTSGTVMLCAWTGACALLAFFSKENGILLFGFLLLIEIFCFSPGYIADTPVTKTLLLRGFLLVPALFVLAYLIYFYFGHLHDYATNYYFTIHERLLTQFRILWRYAGWLTFINPEPMGIYHDDIVPSRGLFEPVTTLVSMAAWLAVSVVAFVYFKTRHVFLFCTLWFIWGHVLESSVLPLSLMFEHRNYLPGYGLVLGMCVFITGSLYRADINGKLKYLLPVAVFILIPGYTFHERVAEWKDERSLILSLIKNKPTSPQSMIMAARFLNNSGDYKTALDAIRYAQSLNPLEASYIFAEAAVQCDNFPDTRFDGDIEAKLYNLQIHNTGTVNTVGQFRQMVQVCKSSTVNYDILSRLYLGLKSTRNEKLSYLASYGFGYIRLQQGDIDAAIDAWEYVVNHDDDSADLKQQLVELKKLRDRRVVPETGSKNN